MQEKLCVLINFVFLD